MPQMAASAAPLTAVAKRDEEIEREEWERRADKLMRQVYANQLGRINSTMERADMAALEAELAAMWQNEPAEIKRALLPFFDEITRYAAYTAVEQLAYAGADWTLINQTVLKLAQERAMAFALQMAEAGEVLTAEIVADWISPGGTMPDLIERITAVWPGRRPDVAAVDAVTDLFAQGQQKAWAASGVVKGYEINTARDSRVCPICAPKEGEYHDIDDVAGLPGYHNHCRCDIRPVVKEPEEL